MTVARERDIMASPDAEDTFPPPQYRRGMDDDMAAEQKTNDSSPSQETSNGQKAASNAKDPLGPRRKRARRVCSACQRAHLTCGEYATVYRYHVFSPESVHATIDYIT